MKADEMEREVNEAGSARACPRLYRAACDAIAALREAEQRVDALAERVRLLEAAFDSLRFYVDASEQELADRGWGRTDALHAARVAEGALLAATPVPTREEGV